MSDYQIPFKAGFKKKDENIGGTAACLKFPNRPSTPENVKIYRKSYFAEPGKRIIHPGIIKDIKKIDPYRKFGIDTSNRSSSNVLGSKILSDHESFRLAKEEEIYETHRTEPLGRSYQRGHVLPEECQKNDFAFGMTKKVIDVEGAKGLIYPKIIDDDDKFKEMYKKSHGISEPGEQKNRNYLWSNNIDPTKFKFGLIDKQPLKEGVSLCLNPQAELSSSNQMLSDHHHISKITSKQVECMKDTFDQLGQVRHLGTTPGNKNQVFGIGGSTASIGAKECIDGWYSKSEQEPDADLGKSINPGWRNITNEQRAFGVPSIRSDIPIPDKRSVADNQNYGNDVNAQYLLYPQEYAAKGISDEEFIQPRDRNEIENIFKAIGYELESQVSNAIWSKAISSNKYTPAGEVSIEEYRTYLNEYLKITRFNPDRIDAWIKEI